MGFAYNQSSLDKREDLLALLSGEGIEIGALHRPSHVPHLKVSYVDRLSRAELLKQYPELKEFPIVEANIIDDAHTLQTLPNSSQDFVLANHVIEHMANPLLALSNWQRVLKRGGRLFLAVPEMTLTFDRERQPTSIDHIIEDFHSPSDERDYEHFRDFALHVSCGVFGVRPKEDFEALAKDLWDKQYSIHYHCWNFLSFCAFLRGIPKILPGWTMELVASKPPGEDEFIFVLERS